MVPTLVLLILGVALLVQGPGNPDVPSSSGLVLGGAPARLPVALVEQPEPGEWVAMSPSPFVPTSVSTGVWTGHFLLVWDHSATGAMFAYDPDFDHWTRLAAASSRSGGGHVMVWTGRAVLIWGGLDAMDHPVAVGRRFTPTRGWATMAPSPLAARSGAHGIWDLQRQRLVIWGGWTGGGANRTTLHDAAAYDPIADAWEPLTPAETDLLVRPTAAGGDPSQSTDMLAGMTMLAATATSPLGGRSDPVVTSTGSELIVWGGMQHGMFPRDGARLGLPPG